MSTEGPARLRLAVVGVCVAATASLVSLGASLFRINGAFADPVMLFPGMRSTSWNNLLLFMAIAGMAGAAAGLIVIHLARRTGWSVLLLIGTVLTAAHVVPLLGFPQTLRDSGSEVVFAVLGAGSILVILGLLGAANWLIDTGARGTGCLIAGLALAGPLLGTLVLRVVSIVEAADVARLKVLGVVLCGIGVAGAITATVLIPVLRRQPEPQPPPAAATVVGGIAAAVAIAPIIVVQFAPNTFSLVTANPTDPDPFRTVFDETSLMLGMSGLAIFVAGIGLAALLGSKPLGAALAVGLVLFAVPMPLGVAIRSLDSRVAVAILAGVGLVLAGLAAASRWRVWVAGGACALIGAVVVAMRPPYFGVERVSAVLAGGLLVLVIVAVITTTAAGAATVADRTRVPAVLGTVAVVIQLGLLYAGTLVWHSGISGDQPGFEPPAADPLTVASGIALLFGALLVVVLPLIRTPAAAPPEPAPPDPDQAVPVAR